MLVKVGVLVGVNVGADVGVGVCVGAAVEVGIGVGVPVGVASGVSVSVGVCGRVEVGIEVGAGVPVATDNREGKGNKNGKTYKQMAPSNRADPASANPLRLLGGISMVTRPPTLPKARNRKTIPPKPRIVGSGLVATASNTLST